MSSQEPSPNIVLIVCDQMGYGMMGADGNSHVDTPNLDRLCRDGVRFTHAHCTNAICSPSRSSLFTGRMPVETGVVSNDRSIHPSVPHLGHILRGHGYRTVYSGKWHIPIGHPYELDGFDVLPAMGAGAQVDHVVTRNCTSWLSQQSLASDPFLLVAGYENPHDICFFAREPALLPEGAVNALPQERVPPLPPNINARPEAPAVLRGLEANFTPGQWKYYLYCYYRLIEQLDREVGRLLSAIRDRGLEENTVVIFISDHGDGAGRHGLVSKWYPYDEAIRVPLVVRGPGAASRRTSDALVSLLDVVPTLCDYATIEPPGNCRGMTLREIIEGTDDGASREFVGAEFMMTGTVVRTRNWKYARHGTDPVEQLFDMVNDPWETRNRAADRGAEHTLEYMRRLTERWLASLTPIETTVEVRSISDDDLQWRLAMRDSFAEMAVDS
jgi:choline-sulfatase